MIEVNQIYNEHCFETMNYMEKNSIDLIITSPFYNTNAKAKGNQTLKNCCESANRTNSVRYDEFVDVMSNDEYCQFTKELFDYFDKVLVETPCVIIYHTVQKIPRACSEQSMKLSQIQISQLLM